jgi:parallel beta-helix repeat protein
VTHNNYNAGLQVYNGNRNTVVRVTSHSNHDAGTGGQNGDGMSVSSGTGNVFRDCHVYNNSDDGLDLWRSARSTIDGCVSHDNGYDTSGNGNGFKIGGYTTDTSLGGHTVMNSIAYKNRATGFDWNGGYGANTLYNNTGWSNGAYNFNFGGGAHVLRNNISYQGTVNMGSAADQSYNSWNLGITDPRFVSLDPASSDFMKPATNSSVIDAGTYVGLPYMGAAPDLGAVAD